MNKFLIAIGLIACTISAPALSKDRGYATGAPFDNYRNTEAADGFKRPVAEYVKPTVTVTMVYFRYWSDLAKQYKQITGEAAGTSVYAFSTINPNNTVCTIYAMDPQAVHAPEYIGHELLHCTMGRWHD